MRHFGILIQETVGPKALALMIVLAMAFADFLTMHNMFSLLGGADTLFIFGHEYEFISETMVYSVTMVALLEGNPWFLGLTLSAALDKGTYKNNDKTNAWWGFWISLFGLILSWGLVVAIRILIIQQNGGYEAYIRKEYPQFVLHVCLAATPVLTSILATVASWTAFRSEQETRLVREIQGQYRQFLHSQKEFLKCLYKNEDTKVALWSSLAARPNGPMPQDFDSFRQECFARIRAKLIENCITQYPDQIQSFNAAVENLLKHCIKEMSKRSTIPEVIAEIDFEKVIAEYDSTLVKEHKNGNAWNYKIAGNELEAELKILLDNAVVTAQFKTSHKPRHMEGEFYP